MQDRLADLTLPVLPGLEVLRIELGMDAIFDKSRIKFMNDFLVTMRVNKKDMDLLG